jgi:hypothetical protein
MLAWLRRFWPYLKVLLTLAILAAVGWQFVRILEAKELQGADQRRNPTEILWDHIRQARPGWLLASAAFYLTGLAISAIFWGRLQQHLGQQLPGAVAVARAYYVSHLGKYLPGKAWALILRASLIQGPGVRIGVAGQASFYEVMTTMTGGALWAAVLFFLLLPSTGTLPDWRTIKGFFTLQAGSSVGLDRNVLVAIALLVALPVGLPIVPPIFNRLVHRTTSPFRKLESAPLPRVRFAYLGEGLALSLGTWLLLGASMTAVFHAVLDGPPEWTLGLWGRHTALFAVGYVASFLMFVVPGSFGVREYSLTMFLVPEMIASAGLDAPEARVVVVASVLILRLIWTLAEVLVSAALYWLPVRRRPEEAT